MKIKWCAHECLMEAAFVCRLWDPQSFMMEKGYYMAFKEMIQEQVHRAPI